MPAASEVPLPRTWRPLGVRLAAYFFTAILVLITAMAWFGFDESIRARFTPFQKGTVLFFGLLVFGLNHALARCRVRADDAGLLVVNGFRSHRLEWAQVLAVRMPTGAPWATLDLSDGSTLAVLGIQGTDGSRAVRAVRELRSLLDR